MATAVFQFSPQMLRRGLGVTGAGFSQLPSFLPCTLASENKRDKQECIWLIFLINCNELPHISALLSILSILPAVRLWHSLPTPERAHLTEPDTEICAANSLHSHGSVWCHNWHTIDLCLLLQRPEWLMSRASCHNRPCPGLLLLGCSHHTPSCPPLFVVAETRLKLC